MTCKLKFNVLPVLLIWPVLIFAGQDQFNTEKHFIRLPMQKKSIVEVSCAPLQACDIALPAGDVIKGLYFGDSSRWIHEIAESGTGEFKQAHVILKPQQENLTTNLIITSSRDTYHVKLIAISSPKNYQFEFFREKKDCERMRNHKNYQEELMNLTDLDFRYMVKYPFFSNKFMGGKLEQIFNDGKHVYIKIPKKWMNQELPALFVEDDEILVLANYRIKGNYYMVDHLFKSAALVFNVGEKQRKLKIIYTG